MNALKSIKVWSVIGMLVIPIGIRALSHISNVNVQEFVSAIMY